MVESVNYVRAKPSHFEQVIRAEKDTQEEETPKDIPEEKTDEQKAQEAINLLA